MPLFMDNLTYYIFCVHCARMVFFLENVTAGVCGAGMKYLYIVYDLGCSTIETMGLYSTYEGALAYIRGVGEL
jgi:hypothetical protein